MSSSQSTPRLLALLAIAAAVGVVGLIVTGRVPELPGAGSGSGGNSNTRALIEEAFSDSAIESRMKSGKVDFDMDVSLTGVPPQLQNFLDMQLNSAFVNRGKDKFAKLDLGIVLTMLGRRAELGVASRDGQTAFVTLEGTTYSVPRSGVVQFETASAENEDDSSSDYWPKNETETGTVVLDGEQTTRITADVDSAKLIDDLNSSSSDGSSAKDGSSEEFYREARSAVRPGHMELFIGKDDGLLRRVMLDVPFEAPRPGGGAAIGGQVKMVLNVRDLNKPQKIEVPKADRPYRELASTFTMDSVSDLFLGVLEKRASSGLAGGTAGSGAGSAGQAPSAPAPDDVDQAAQTQSASLPSEAQSYLGCVRKAGSQAAVQACSSHLP